MYTIHFDDNTTYTIDEDTIMKMGYFKNMLLDIDSSVREYHVPHRDSEGFGFVLKFLADENYFCLADNLDEELDFYDISKYESNCQYKTCFQKRAKFYQGPLCNVCVTHRCKQPLCPKQKLEGKHGCKDHICIIVSCPNLKTYWGEACTTHECHSHRCPNARVDGKWYCDECVCIIEGCNNKKDKFGLCGFHLTVFYHP